MPRIVCATDLGLRILFKLSILTSLGRRAGCVPELLVKKRWISIKVSSL
jgi:hypothetical protein